MAGGRAGGGIRTRPSTPHPCCPQHTRQGVLEDDTMLPCVGNDAVGLQASGRLR